MDEPEENRKFAESLELDYPILSDPEKKAARAYGVLGSGGEYAKRHTIYIGTDGKILHIDREVKPSTAGMDVVEHLEALDIPKKAE